MNKIFEAVIRCLIIVILALLLYFILRILIKRLITAFGGRMSERKLNTLRTVLLSVSKYSVIFFASCEVLKVLGVGPQTVLTVAGVGSVAIGFGAQSLVKDFITGLFILMEDQFGVGDVITVEDRSGVVEYIGLRTTRIRSLDGSVHIIPNSEIRIVTNISSGFNRALVDIGIPYDENLDRVLIILNNEMETVYKEVKGLKNRPNVLGVTALTDRGVNIRIMADCESGQHWSAEREMRRFIVNRLNRECISFPYPHNVVRVENGDEDSCILE